MTKQISKDNQPKILVDDWKQGWKWFSTYAFLIIAYVAQFGVPQEIIDVVPLEHRGKIITVVALCGLIFRFVKQSKVIPFKK